jgi:acyl-CoA dehydrogenase
MESIVRVFDEIGGEEAILSFSDVRIPDTYRIGPANQGFRVAMQGSDQLRLTKLGRVIGLGRWALGQAFEYSQSRRTFGKALSEHQTVQNMLAESCIRVHAAKLMSIDLADKIDRGESVRAETAMTHAYTVEAMYEVYDRAMQVLGGMGLANETGFINGWHHIRVARIAEGPTEIQLRTIMNQLLRGGVSL